MNLSAVIAGIRGEQEEEQENGDEEKDSWVYLSSFLHVRTKRRPSETGPWPRLFGAVDVFDDFLCFYDE